MAPTDPDPATVEAAKGQIAGHISALTEASGVHKAYQEAGAPAPTKTALQNGKSQGTYSYDPKNQMANYETIAKYLVDNGYSKAVAAGIVSCIAGESGGNPEALQSGKGPGGGLIQWTPHTGIPITGNAQDDFNAQLPLILDYNKNAGAGNLKQLKEITDPIEAGKFYSKHFERPEKDYSDFRESVARKVYEYLNKLGS